MQRIPFARPAGMAGDDHAGRIDEYCRAQGWAIDGVSVSPDVIEIDFPDGVQVPADAAAKIGAYVTAETARERFERIAIEDAKAVIRAIAQKPRADRTPVERALLGLAVRTADIAND